METAAQGEQASGATLSFNITVQGSDVGVFVYISTYLASTGSSVSSVTIGGSAATLINRLAIGDTRHELWYRVGVASGSQSIVITPDSSSAEVVAVAACLSGVHQYRPIGTSDIQTGYQTDPSNTLTSASDELCLQGVKYWSDTIAAGTGETVQIDNNNAGGYYSTTLLTEAGAASVTMNPNLVDNVGTWWSIAVPVKPAVAGGVKVEVWGGGGAGGGTTTNTTSKGGGAAGGQYVVDNAYKGSSPAKSFAYTVAATKTATTGSGGAGNDSTFDSTGVVAKGGAGGGAYQVDGGTAGQGSTASGVGDTVYRGGNGSAGGATATGGAGGGGAGTGGNGGDASGNTRGTGTATGGGNGGAGRTSAGVGNAGAQAGGGGGAGYATTSADRAGGTGAAGRVDLTWAEPHITTFLWGVQ